jgi:hypothetical protein
MLVVTSPKSGGRSVGIIRLWTKAAEFTLEFREGLKGDLHQIWQRCGGTGNHIQIRNMEFSKRLKIREEEWGNYNVYDIR